MICEKNRHSTRRNFLGATARGPYFYFNQIALININNAKILDHQSGGPCPKCVQRERRSSQRSIRPMAPKASLDSDSQIEDVQGAGTKARGPGGAFRAYATASEL